MPRPVFIAWAMAGALAGLAAPLVVARADIPPPPGAEKRSAAALIRGAGYACADVDRFEEPPAEGAAKSFPEGLSVTTAVCSDGKRFLVGTPPRRRPGPPMPDAPTPPQPVVRPLPQ